MRSARSRWSRARRPATCWPACCWTACASAGRGLQAARHRRRRRWRRSGFEAWWPHEKLAVRGYVEVLRHYREIVGIRSQLREPPAARAAAGLHRRRRARLQPRPRSGPARSAASRPCISSARRSGPGGRSASRRSARRRPRAVHLPVRAGAAGAARHRGHLRRPSAGQRDPAWSPTGPRRAPRSGWPTDGEVVAILPGSRRSEVAVPGRRASSRRRR